MGDPARIYPKADAKTQWWETAFDRATFTSIEKVLLHTTETTSWPGYKAGASAPTLTYHPRLRAWRQHNYLDRSARALVDPTSTPVRENRDNVIQIEIVAYSDEAVGRSVGGLPVSELTDAQLGDLAAFIAWVRSEWGGPPLVAPKFLPYPSSYGNSAVRMTSSEYDAFRGVLGHQHASGNAHGDPGALNVPRILALATPIKEEDMPTADEIVDAMLARRVVNPETGIPYPLEVWWREANVKAGDARALGRESVAMLTGLTEAVKALAAGTDVDVDAVLKAAHDGAAEGAKVDVPALAAAIAAALPPDSPITDQQLQAALRAVLGSLDEAPASS